jgi:Flp pilus assembly protein TadB
MAVGVAAAAACATLLILALAPRSRVVSRLDVLRPRALPILGPLRRIKLIAPSTLRASGLTIVPEQFVAAKIAAASVCALVAAVVSLFVPIGALVICAAAYGGFVIPSLVVERRAADRRHDAEKAIAAFVEWTHALVSSGRPPDSAIVALARRGTGAPLVDDVLERVDRLYTLGAPLYVSLLREAKEAALPTLCQVAERLERSRELGQGSIGVLEDLRDDLRSAIRERLLASASQVEAKATVILTLCYLPALALLVVIPLFVTLLAGLFG